MNDENSPDAMNTPASPAKAKASKANENVPPPAASAQVMVNLRTWAPFLQNPTQRASLIRYPAREKRDSGTWRIGLPVMCWKCQTKDGLKTRKVSWTIRSFESAIPIGVAGGTFTAIQLMLALLMVVQGSFYWAAVLGFTGTLTGLLAFGTLFLKSWTEEVKVSLQTCPKCEFEFRAPEMGTDQEMLHLFLPSVELAAAAIAEQKAERRSKKGGPAEASGESGDEEARPKKKPKPAQGPSAGRQHAAELPPITLDEAPVKVVAPGERKSPAKPAAPAPRKPPDELPPIKLDD